MTFLGSSDRFSLGSKWFWYLQNDKIYTLGPTESPNGVRKGPRRAKIGPQNPTGPLQAYFSLFWGGGRPENFICPFGPKKDQNVFPNFFYLNYFDSQRVWDPQKPKIDPVDPQWTPFWPDLWAKRPILGSKKTRFSQIFFAQNHF